MSLEQKDIELLERVIYKNGDDVAVSIGRSFERLEERIDAAESRVYSRFADIEDKVESSRQDIADELSDVKGEVRELARIGNEEEGD
jgi:prefoldin subunit 5